MELDKLVDKIFKLGTFTNAQSTSQAVALHRERYATLEKIIQLESTLYGTVETDSTNNREDGAILGDLLKWIEENGAYFKGVEIAKFTGYDLGLKTVRDISKDTLVIAVPRNLMLTVEEAKKSVFGPLIEKDYILKNMPNVALAMFLLVEKFCHNSFWKPYINFLPRAYTTILYFTLDELEELYGSQTLDCALKQIQNISRQYAYFYKLINSSDNKVYKKLRNHFTYKNYCWAVSTVMTRQNTVPSEDGNITALIPLWDMCNHTNGTITTGYNPVLNRSECLALKDFKVGEQLFIFYGVRTNSELFVHNGFVYEENMYDKYRLRLGISKSDDLLEKRINVLNKLSLSSVNDFYLEKGMQFIDGQLLAFARIFNMNEDCLQYYLESDKCQNLKNPDYVTDVVLEKKTWNFLQARIKLILSAYKTSLEVDKTLIAENQLSPNKLLAIKMRVSEKNILNEVLDCIQQHIEKL